MAGGQNKRIWTLDALMRNCDIDGDCWLWRGGKANGGRAICRHEGQPQLAARVALDLVDPMAPPRGPRMAYVPACGRLHCISPLCCRWITRSQTLRQSVARAEREGRPWRDTATMAASARERSRLGVEKVRQIRADPRPAAVVARAFGVSRSLVAKIRCGKVWNDPAAMPTAPPDPADIERERRILMAELNRQRAPKLTRAEAARMRVLRHEQKLSIKQLAAEFGVSESTVSMVCCGRTWAAPPAKITRIPTPAGRYEVTGPFERVITGDWMLRRQGAAA